jgi:integrase
MATDYFANQIAPATRLSWSRYLRMVEHPDVLGTMSVDEVRPRHIQAFLDCLASKPSSQRNARAALKRFEAWAILAEELPYAICTGTTLVKYQDHGHAPWTDEQITWAIDNLPPHFARAIILGANTGQRVSDLVRMQWSHITSYRGQSGIKVWQQKTRKKTHPIWIPLTGELEAAMREWPKPAALPDYILRKADGQPWTAKQLTNSFYSLRKRPDVKQQLRELGSPLATHDAVMHGLRATAVVRLRLAGLSEGDIASLVGMSVPMVARYAREADQREKALAAHQRREPGALVTLHKRG